MADILGILVPFGRRNLHNDMMYFDTIKLQQIAIKHYCTFTALWNLSNIYLRPLAAKFQ